MVDIASSEGESSEQLRPPIVRSTGFTTTERYLAQLADKTFLNLWSYPSPYREQQLRGAGDGKELCDLLVVCDPHVVIFSEKAITWSSAAVDVAWPRWLKRAVFEASKQLKGAERWISEFPDRIFLDKDCTQRFPLSFPPAERRRIHRIVIARGAGAACRKHFGGGSGTFLIKPLLSGKAHLQPSNSTYGPFTIGDIDPSGDFVHVFDEVSLEVVMREMDTITDFTDYLDKRANLIRSGRLVIASGEEDLLAYYAIRLNEEGEHDFTPPDGKTWADVDGIVIDGGFRELISNPRYIAKKQADRQSYVWDALIEAFTGPLMDGTSLVPTGQEFSLAKSEQAVRFMAHENRFYRRNLGAAVRGAFEIGRNKDIFFRMMPGRPIDGVNETMFFIATIKYLPHMQSDGGYQRYREFRAFYLQLYAQAILMKNPEIRRIIGIGMEPPGQGEGASEDNILAFQSDWTDEERSEVDGHCKALGIMQNLKPRPYQFDEFPQAPIRKPSRRLTVNRKQRRAAKSKARKAKK